MKLTYRCPRCGSAEVEMLVTAWLDLNSDRIVEINGCAELYSDLYWCRDCEDHFPYPVEVTNDGEK